MRFLNMHGLGAASMVDPLGEPLGSGAPSSQIAACTAAGLPNIGSQAFADWFASTRAALGNGAPWGIPDVLYIQQKMGLTDAQLACLLQTYAPYSSEVQQYQQYLNCQPASIGKLGGNGSQIVLAPSCNGIAVNPAGVQTPISSSLQSSPVPSATPAGTTPAGTTGTLTQITPGPGLNLSSLSALPWYYWAGGAALIWFLFRGQ